LAGNSDGNTSPATSATTSERTFVLGNTLTAPDAITLELAPTLKSITSTQMCEEKRAEKNIVVPYLHSILEIWRHVMLYYNNRQTIKAVQCWLPHFHPTTILTVLVLQLAMLKAYVLIVVQGSRLFASECWS
jgi:hypothetical protein